MINLDDLNDDEEFEELDDWYNLYDDLINGYYLIDSKKGKVKRTVPEWWKLSDEQIFSSKLSDGMLIQGANEHQLKYIRILANKYNCTVDLTNNGIEVLFK